MIFSLEYEKIGLGYNTLDKQDYIISIDKSAMFIKITKKFESKVEYHLKIKVLLPGQSLKEWLVLFVPEGLLIRFFLLLLLLQ